MNNKRKKKGGAFMKMLLDYLHLKKTLPFKMVLLLCFRIGQHS